MLTIKEKLNFKSEFFYKTCRKFPYNKRGKIDIKG